MPDPGYVTIALAVAVAVTVTLRAVPFAVKDALKGSPLIADLGRWMPLGAVTILAVYCLSRMNLHDPRQALPQVGGAVVTLAVHRWRHNVVLSILAGTSTCVLLANWVVPALT